MVIIEVNKPRKLWWAKTLKREILIMIPLVLLSILGRGDSDIVLWVLKVTTLLLIVNLIFSHDYEYPYRVKVNDEGVEVDYIHLGINLKHYFYGGITIMISMDMIREAPEVVKAAGAVYTPILNIPKIAENLYVKCENLQKTGSFKLRGATYKISKLTDAEKKYVRKYLGIEGVEAAIANTIRGKKKEVSDGTSSYGNIVITGKADTDRSGFAINLFKALHAGESTKQLRIAKTTSASLHISRTPSPIKRSPLLLSCLNFSILF